MIHKLLPTLSLGLLCFILHGQNLKFFHYGLQEKSDKRGSAAVYEALITGDKTGVSKKTLATMKNFGLMHLLTPSGLHLGSFLLLFKFFPKMKFLTTLLLFICSFSTPGFLALKRMLIFYLVNFRLKNVQLSFFATFLLSLLTGNYSESPMSFCFTFIFWGSIVFHRGGRWSLAKKLFVLQAAIAFLFHQEINLSALAINPAVTVVFSLVFPLLLFLYPLEPLRQAGLFLVEGFVGAMELLEHLSFLNVAGEVAVLFYFLLAWRNKIALSAILLFLSASLNLDKKSKRKVLNIHYPLPDAQEHLKTKRRRVEFIDRTCGFNFQGDVYCKKKPSHLGGPVI